MWVDASRKAVEATDAEQEARPKVTLQLIDNGNGTFSYAPHVYLLNPSLTVGPVDVTIGGTSPDADTTDGVDGTTRAVQAVKVRLGAAGVDAGLVEAENPLPTVDADARVLFAEALGELKVIRLLLEAITR